MKCLMVRRLHKLPRPTPRQNRVPKTVLKSPWDWGYALQVNIHRCALIAKPHHVSCNVNVRRKDTVKRCQQSIDILYHRDIVHDIV